MGTYTPQETSTAGKIIGFLQKNPDEVLGIDDVSVKFEVPRKQVHSILAQAVFANLVVRDRDADGEYVYKAGSAKPGAIVTAAPASWPPGAATSSTPASKDAIVIEDDLPIPPKQAAGRFGEFLEALQKLQLWPELRDREEVARHVGQGRDDRAQERRCEVRHASRRRRRARSRVEAVMILGRRRQVFAGNLETDHGATCDISAFEGDEIYLLLRHVRSRTAMAVRLNASQAMHIGKLLIGAAVEAREAEKLQPLAAISSGGGGEP